LLERGGYEGLSGLGGQAGGAEPSDPGGRARARWDWVGSPVIPFGMFGRLELSNGRVAEATTVTREGYTNTSQEVFEP